ncbi:MAG: zinc-dependent metalloprotease [Acidimicrobiales bacterium]|nr:zinc-dependent metalloprotease [Acidimicrobiales bacterium]
MSEQRGAAPKGPEGNGSVPVAPDGDASAGSASGSSALSWVTAERVARWVGNRSRPSELADPAALQHDFEELTAQAEELVAAATGLRSASGPARARVTDRAGWVHANIASFQRLVGPHLDRLDPSRAVRAHPLTERLAGPVAVVGRTTTGAQMGLILGWLSTRVLGQYDLLLTEEAVEDQDLVYFVGPNILALERQHGFEPREFRLWLALHEVTHRCQFTAIPWMRDYFVSLVEEGIGSLDPDPARFAEALRRMSEEIRAGRNPLKENGALGLVATPEQLEGIQRIQALMSLLEGHGDVTMDRAGAAVIPSAGRFAEVLRQRRRQVKGPARLLQQLIGLEAKLRQYEEGERFIAAVEESGGPQLLDRAWQGPEWLPSLQEIREPSAWISRVGATHALSG